MKLKKIESKIETYGVFIGLLALILMFIIFWIDYPRPISKDDLVKITDRYDPVFKNILIRDAYQILAYLHCNELVWIPVPDNYSIKEFSHSSGFYHRKNCQAIIISHVTSQIPKRHFL